VHEGPQQIRKNVRPCTLVPFEEGMTITDEPGLYIEGKFGVRIENVLLVQPHSKTPYGTFLHFENLTLCPISTSPIVKEMLTPEEVAWVNNYNAHVCKELTPLLDDEVDKQWLSKETQAI
jgi:Xaa-Pro aminopeptidase